MELLNGLITIEDLAKIMKTKPKTIYTWIYRGVIKPDWVVNLEESTFFVKIQENYTQITHRKQAIKNHPE